MILTLEVRGLEGKTCNREMSAHAHSQPATNSPKTHLQTDTC